MKTPAEIRRDLMARWFAVAISVGFATTLVHMNWLNSGEVPNKAEGQQLIRLAVAMTAVLFSWEGYFSSIARKALTSWWRFLIDFVLVLLYMVLLYTSKIPTFWIYIHTISFVLYISWDILTIRDYPGDYVRGAKQYVSPLSVYSRALLGKEGIYRGPAVTLLWAIYFLGLSAMQWTMGARNSWVMFFFVWIPLIQYRNDKICTSNDYKNHTKNYSIFKIFLFIVILWALLLVIFQNYNVAPLGCFTETCE